jgi:hypothetical protein
MHYKRKRKHGDANYQYRPPRRPLIERFHEKCEINSLFDCWIWIGATDLKGYGKIYIGERASPAMAAHRVSWELHCGPIPEGLNVLHRCDNPPCVNPSHLFLGTIADNNADMDAKGRRVSKPRFGPRPPEQILRGDRHPMAKLTAVQVFQIRERLTAGQQGKIIAIDFGISADTVSRIKIGRTWKHS